MRHLVRLSEDLVAPLLAFIAKRSVVRLSNLPLATGSLGRGLLASLGLGLLDGRQAPFDLVEKF